MDRSDFYYKQNVTQAELDQAFDDCENADRNQIVDDWQTTPVVTRIWGVFRGLQVTEQAAPDLTVLVSWGAAYDQQGRRINLSSGTGSQTVNLASHVPATPGESVYVRVYAEFNRTLSDSRTDGLGATIDYRQEETFLLSSAAGTASATPTKPALVADKVCLATVLLAQGQTQIQNSDISLETRDSVSSPDRQGGGFLNRDAMQDPDGTKLIWDTGTQDVVKLGGNNIDAESGNISDVDGLTFDASGSVDPAIDVNNRNVSGVDKLDMDSSGSADPAIDLNNRNIGFVNQLICAASGDATAISSNSRDIITLGGELDTGTGDIHTGIGASGGGDVKTHGGQVVTGEGGSGGGAIGTHGGLIATDGGHIYTYAGEFRHGSANKRTQKLYLPASDAECNRTYWNFVAASAGALYGRWSCTTISSPADRLIFPVHLPYGAEIISYAARVSSPTVPGVSMQLVRNQANWGSPATAPSDRALVTGATQQQNTTTNFETLQDTLSAAHTIDPDYFYYIVFRPIVTATLVAVVEVVYDIETLKAGLH